MLVLFGILVIIASVILGLIVLIQNPKGGGLSASLGGFSNQLMGVKQTTDVLEKGTWVFAALVGLLCLASPAFIPKNASSSSKNDDLL
ncbi:MAG: preprotein translocase subunit SecG, partial [Bacteroidota bacterium]